MVMFSLNSDTYEALRVLRFWLNLWEVMLFSVSSTPSHLVEVNGNLPFTI